MIIPFKTPLRKAIDRKRRDGCQWWLNCDNPATTVRSHPILGDVPICKRCDDKISRTEGDAS
jgi:hypothetical protein